MSIADQLPEEPSSDCTEPVKVIRVRGPGGLVLTRRFLAQNPLQVGVVIEYFPFAKNIFSTECLSHSRICKIILRKLTGSFTLIGGAKSIEKNVFMKFKVNQGGHGPGKTGNLVLTFSRQGKHREFCCNTGKVFETQGKYFIAKSMFLFTCFQNFFALLRSA